MTERVSDALDHVLLALDIMTELALRPDGYDEVAAEQKRLGTVIRRTQLILSFIEAGKPTPKTVGRVN